MFKADNTEGFNATELRILNTALRALVSRGWDEQAASDALNNAWTGNTTSAEQLVERCETGKAAK